MNESYEINPDWVNGIPMGFLCEDPQEQRKRFLAYIRPPQEYIDLFTKETCLRYLNNGQVSKKTKNLVKERLAHLTKIELAKMATKS